MLFPVSFIGDVGQEGGDLAAITIKNGNPGTYPRPGVAFEMLCVRMLGTKNGGGWQADWACRPEFSPSPR